MYEAIPKELKEMDNWVCSWDSSKVPMRAFEKKAASSSDPTTWADFNTAYESVSKGYYDHLGYVFNDNGYVGIDIDIGYDEDGFFSPTCIDIINTCRSYTEQSKSGRGVHIILKGDLPFAGKNNRKGVEIYKTKRYFIMTGKKLIYPTIIENQAAIDYVVSKYFTESLKINNSTTRGSVIYNITYEKPTSNCIKLRPTYPPIDMGSRNLCLTSLAGRMYNLGYSKKDIYLELLYVNETACSKPLNQREVQSIVESIARYRR